MIEGRQFRHCWRDIYPNTMSAMAIIAATLVMLAPFALAIALSWIARRNKTFRIHLDHFRIAAPMGGTFAEDRDLERQRHELEAIRTRY